MTEFQAALLNVQLERLEADTALRAANAARVIEGLAHIEGLSVQPADERITRRAWHLFCLRLDPERFGCSKEALVAAVRAEGLYLTPGYALPLHRQPCFAPADGSEPPACPVAEDLAERSGTWFSHFILLGPPEDMDDVVRIFEKVAARAGDLGD
jgi:dTDP-4-amino-4,6-dideoxygalactose transaminase